MDMSRSHAIILLRDPDGEDAYAVPLQEQCELRTVCVPVIATSSTLDAGECIGGSAGAAILADASAHWRGFVLTSHRAATVLAQLLGHARPHDLPPGMPCFGIGRKTLAPLATSPSVSSGFNLTLMGEDAGTAEGLAETIIAWDRLENCGDGTPKKPLAFLCGDRHLPVLPARLAAAGVPVEEVVVYRTVERPAASLELELRTALQQPTDFIVFFSPSGVAAFVSAEGVADAVRRSQKGDGHSSDVERADGTSLDTTAEAVGRVRLIALGPTTSAAMQCAGLAVAAVCGTPDADGVVAAVRQLTLVR